MSDITLAKEKYRNPNSRIERTEASGIVTRVYRAGRFKSPSNNSGKKQVAKQGTGHRRRQGLGGYVQC